ncbi:hypothetical protein JZO73_05830 [Enterococcus plantarum]|uniref:hypothetical protein n=1 Tax=Enterococcus plantarum TaxID=1077675 RepID=UPI001A8D49EF|nr:hypothetical protein [Enterococcus plantarum]MBO0467051.1 hypothetical protein [Enterococcus plantarum]
MKEELSNGKKFVDNAEKIDKSFSEIRHLFITAPEDELIGMITNLNPHISLKKRYIRIYHDLIILTSRRIGKEATQRLAENSCQSFTIDTITYFYIIFY